MRILKMLALPGLGFLALLAGLTFTPDAAEAGKITRAVGKAATKAAVKSAVRPARKDRGRDEAEEDDEEVVGATKKVDHEARVREAQAKLAAEGEDGAVVAAVTPVSTGNSAQQGDETKVVCVAGC